MRIITLAERSRALCTSRERGREGGKKEKEREGSETDNKSSLLTHRKNRYRSENRLLPSKSPKGETCRPARRVCLETAAVYSARD